MAGFVFIKYEGADAGDVLVTMLSEEHGPETHELESHTEIRRVIGFQPNPEEPEEEEPDDPDAD